jgi:hypothetical protein
LEFLKDLRFSLALFAVGAIFLLLALTGGFSAAGYTLVLANLWLRAAAGALGLTFVAAGAFWERNPQISSRDPNTPSPLVPLASTPSILNAEKFFFTLDDKAIETFPLMIQDAARVKIFGRTAVNLLGQYQRVFEHMATSGCEVNLLFVDPNSDACNFLYGSNPEIYRNNIVTAASHLKRLRKLMGHGLQVRVTKHAPTLSVIIVEKANVQDSFIQVQLYFLHSAVGRDRPLFKVLHGDKWHRVFSDEFNQLWAQSREWDESNLLNVSLS